MGFELRPYQFKAIDGINQNIAIHGNNRIVLVSPTGSGKTVLFTALIKDFLDRHQKPAIVIVHRKELVDQALDKLSLLGIEAGVIMGNDYRRDPENPVQVCSIQTLARRMDRLPPADLIIYDECHHSLSDSAQKVLKCYPEAILIGCTATPFRSDKFALGDIYQAMVVAATPSQLMELGALVKYEAYAYLPPDLRNVRIVAGDFNQQDLEHACNTDALVGNIIKEYQAHAHNRRAIVFPVSVDHSKRIIAQFKDAGYPAAHIDWSTPKQERFQMLEDFKAGSIIVLSSVGVLSEGFDAPAAEVAILARPTKSLALHLQCVGRVLRPSPDTGKKLALIHDHAGNLRRLGLPDDEREYSLEPTEQHIKVPHTCTDCNAVVTSWKPDGTCPYCGSLQKMVEKEAEEEEKKEESFRSRIRAQIENGIRVEIRQLLSTFAENGVVRQLTDDQALKVARATRTEKAAEYLRLCEIAKRKNFKKGFIGHAYRNTFGVWPKFTDDELRFVTPARYPFIPLPPRPTILEAR